MTEVNQFLWGKIFWTSGYYINTLGQYANEEVINKYLKDQGRVNEYKKIYTSQLKLFGYLVPLGRASSLLKNKVTFSHENY